MCKLLRVLLAEDDPGNAEMVKRLLSRSTRSKFTVEWVEAIADAAREVASGQFDVLLLDLGLPGTQDLESLAAIQGVNAPIPIIIVTGQTDEAVAIRALHDGAQDYLIKGNLTTDSLVRSIHYACERHGLARTLADAHIALESKNKRLAKLYRTAYKFVDNVSHEFRTPLTVIKEYVSLIKDGIVGSVSSEQRQMLTVVEDRADDLNTMVDDMLDVSKLEAGLLGVYRKQCFPSDVVAHVRTVLERKAVVKGVQLEWDIDADLPPVYCDPEKAGRVLINLTVNSIKFCGQPGHVRVSCRKLQEPAGVEFGVTDNGAGIGEKNQLAIFRRFKQLNQSVRSSTKGFGLGLSIAKELVEANLGEIRVDSAPGRGSTFFFTLPLADPAEILRRYLHRLGQLRKGPPYISLVQADISEPASGAAAEDIDGFLSCLLRFNDLLLRVGAQRWLIVLPVTESEVPAFRRRAENAFSDASRNHLGDPLAPIDFRVLGTWGVHDRDNILTTLRAMVRAEEVACA